MEDRHIWLDLCTCTMPTCRTPLLLSVSSYIKSATLGLRGVFMAVHSQMLARIASKDFVLFRLLDVLPRRIKGPSFGGLDQKPGWVICRDRHPL